MNTLPEIRKLPMSEDGQRVESGPIQFGDDWPGTFIRGDEAAYFAACLASVLAGTADNTEKYVSQNLLEELRSSNLVWRQKHDRPAAKVSTNVLTSVPGNIACPTCGCRDHKREGCYCKCHAKGGWKDAGG